MKLWKCGERELKNIKTWKRKNADSLLFTNGETILFFLKTKRLPFFGISVPVGNNLSFFYIFDCTRNRRCDSDVIGRDFYIFFLLRWELVGDFFLSFSLFYCILNWTEIFIDGNTRIRALFDVWKQTKNLRLVMASSEMTDSGDVERLKWWKKYNSGKLLSACCNFPTNVNWKWHFEENRS